MEAILNFDYRAEDVRDLFDMNELAALVVEREGKPPSSEVSISFVTDEAMRALNRDYRGIDRPTDVLSFECDNLEDGFANAPEGGPYELGDIVIAVDVAFRQAPEYGLSFADEVSLLVTHGLLHLCGYDHVEEGEARAMEARERELLSEFWGRPFKRSEAEEADGL